MFGWLKRFRVPVLEEPLYRDYEPIPATQLSAVDGPVSKRTYLLEGKGVTNSYTLSHGLGKEIVVTVFNKYDEVVVGHTISNDGKDAVLRFPGILLANRRAIIIG